MSESARPSAVEHSISEVAGPKTREPTRWQKLGLAALVVTHHVNLAARFADRVLVLHRGRVAATGTAAEVIRREVLEMVFGWPLEVTAWRRVPQFVPLRQSEVES